MKRATFSIRILAISALLCLAATTALAADKVVEEIIARVNDKIITSTEFQHGREQMLNEARQQGLAEGDPRLQQNEKNLLRDMIDQQLLVQKGQELGITADTELVKRLDEIRKQMNLDSMEALEKAAQEQGISFDEFKQNLRNQIITQQVIQHEIGSKIQITQEEQKLYYEEHKGELGHPEQVRLSEILIAPANDQPEALAAAQQKAEQALAAIKGGKAFDEVAKEVSNGPTAAQGGDLGMFKRGTLARELEDKVFAMKAGDMSDVIRTKQGFVILKVTEHEQAGVPPFEQVSQQIQQKLYMEKLQPSLRQYLTKLREQAFINIKPGYVDTGASPNETQPIVVAQGPSTSSGPQQAPKHKKKKKFGIF